MACWGCFSDGDVVAEGFELADGAGPGLGRVAPGEVVGAEVAVELAGGEHVPGRDEYGVFECDDGFDPAAAGGKTLVFGGQVRVFGL